MKQLHQVGCPTYCVPLHVEKELGDNFISDEFMFSSLWNQASQHTERGYERILKVCLCEGMELMLTPLIPTVESDINGTQIRTVESDFYGTPIPTVESDWHRTQIPTVKNDINGLRLSSEFSMWTGMTSSVGMACAVWLTSKDIEFHSC